MRRAGLKPEEEVFVSVRPRRIEISANPAETLWGTLKSEKSAEELTRSLRRPGGLPPILQVSGEEVIETYPK